MRTPGQFDRLLLVIGLLLLSICFAVEFFAWASTRAKVKHLSQAEQEILSVFNFEWEEPLGSV
jgi:hypothetical protein